MASNIYFGGEDAFTQQLIPGLPEEVTMQLFSFRFRPFQLNYLNRAPGGSYYATSYCASTNLFGSCTSYENQYFGGGGGGIGQKSLNPFHLLNLALLPRSGWKPLQHNVLQRPGLWRWRWTIKNQTKSKTSPQAKRHQPSLLFTSLAISTSLTFITR